MKKLIFLFFVAFSAIATEQSFTTSEEKYITDDIPVYVRRGPSLGHQITGTLKIGEKVTILEQSTDKNFTKIKDSREKIYWIETVLLTDKKSILSQPELLNELKQEISQLQQVNQQNIDNKNSFENKNIELTSKLNEANKLIKTLELELIQVKKEEESKPKLQLEELDEKLQSIKLTWFTRGGIIAGIGLLIGLILPIILPRRKSSTWIN